MSKIAIIARSTIKADGEYFESGQELSVERAEAQRLIDLGVARPKGEPEEAPAAASTAPPSNPGGGAGAGGGSETPSPQDEIVAAIGRLDPDNEDHFTKAGLPEVRALELDLGRQITAAERDAAWVIFQAKGDDD